MDLSVLVPTYNRHERLRRNLLSLSYQTFAHDRFEVLVVDDGSTDDTKLVVEDARLRYDYRLRYLYVPHEADRSPASPWNIGAKRAQAPIIVYAGADIVLAKDALALLYDYQRESDGNQFTFGQCYRVHSPMANTAFDFVHWWENIDLLGSYFITPYHHSAYWHVPMLAALPKAWFERLHGHDESYTKARWGDDDDFFCRLEACGVIKVNALNVWGAHQYHPQFDVVCEENCDCPLRTKSCTTSGPNLKYNGTPEDLVRNIDSWGECPGVIEA